jgi:hypothetical protein
MKSFIAGYLSALAGTALIAVLIVMPWRNGAEDSTTSRPRDHVRPHAAPENKRRKPTARRSETTGTEAKATTGTSDRSEAEAPDSAGCGQDCDGDDPAEDADNSANSTPPPSTEPSSTPDVEPQSPPGLPVPPDIAPYVAPTG